MDIAGWVAVIGSVPGILALGGAFAGYIRLEGRVANLETQMNKLAEMRDKVIVIEQTAKNTEGAVTHLEGSVQQIGNRMDTFLSSMMGEMRGALAGRSRQP